MGKPDDIMLILSGMFIIIICIIVLLILLSVRRARVRRYRVLAMLFSMIGDAGILLVFIGITQTLGLFL